MAFDYNNNDDDDKQIYRPIYTCKTRQESWAITKMTARCALCMGALKIFRSP